MSPISAALLWLLAAAGAANAQQFTSCTSDEQAEPAALLERFINADCEDCWKAGSTPKAGERELAIDWIVPGRRGEDAPLSVAARNEALDRLAVLRRPVPAASDSVRTTRQPGAGRLRLAHGPAFGGYVGASIQSLGAGQGPFTGWLALVETLPAGTEGSPVERNLVRNLMQVPWPAAPGRRFEARPMNIPAGANPDRLRLVGWLQDSRGVIRAISETRCDPEDPKR